MLMALVGSDKTGKFIDMRRPRDKSRKFYYSINLLVLLKTDSEGNDLAKYITGKDFLNFFYYLFHLQSIYIDTWSRIGE